MDTGPHPMTSYVRLLVADPAASRRFYEALGFTAVQVEPPFIHLRWAPDADVFLVSTPAGQTLAGQRGGGVLLCFEASEVGVGAVVERARGVGGVVVGPMEQPWHTREAVVSDPDGYRLVFVEPA